METQYSQRLKLMHALCLAATSRDDETPNTNLDDYDALNAADYLSCYVTFKAIQTAERSPLAERSDNFDMLSVYQAYALLTYAFFTPPLVQEGIKLDFQGKMQPRHKRKSGSASMVIFAIFGLIFFLQMFFPNSHGGRGGRSGYGGGGFGGGGFGGGSGGGGSWGGGGGGFSGGGSSGSW